MDLHAGNAAAGMTQLRSLQRRESSIQQIEQRDQHGMPVHIGDHHDQSLAHLNFVPQGQPSHGNIVLPGTTSASFISSYQAGLR